MIRSKISLMIWNVLVNSLGKSYIISNKARYFLYKLAGMRTKSSNIRAGVIFRGKSVFIGKGVLINNNCFIDAYEKVVIGDNTSVAFNVLICTSSHEIGKETKRAGESKRKQVIIGSGCWIGANATILPGVRIGDGCVIGAGSVVIRDCEPNTLYTGVPAKKVKVLD